jgi:type II secretion system protein H
MRPINNKGFTLVEVLLVLVVTALLAGLAIPSLKSTLQHYRLYSTVSDFEKTVMYGRERAVMESRVLRWELDRAKSTFFLYELTPDEKDKSLAPVEVNHRAYPKEIQIQTDVQNDEIWFYPDGSHTPFTCRFEQAGFKKVTISSKGTMARLTRQEQNL